MKQKILYITPHLSTGGLPQYLLKKIETFKDEFEIHCIEWSNISGDAFVVQRNKIVNLLSNNFFSLPENKSVCLDLISLINPDFIHFEEVPETFIDESILEKIYTVDRNYKILVSTHSSTTKPESIKFTADKFILVSEWSMDIFKGYFGDSIDLDIWEYPIEIKNPNKLEFKKKLGFEEGYKHILNVGLFTPGKNQVELIELARQLQDYPIKFHFVGNQAINFSDYWSPLMENLPKNCIIHGEKSNIDEYFAAADLFYFTSNFELNPLVVKEALSFQLPTFIKNLHTYKNCYNGLVEYISTNQSENKERIINKFFNMNDSISVVISHPNNDWRKKLLKNCLQSLKTKVILSTNYTVDEETQSLTDYHIYDKTNPLLFKEEFEKYGVVYNYIQYLPNGESILIPFEYEHSYAVYCLIKSGIEMAKKLGYTKVHVINYDYEIGINTISENSNILNQKDIVVYQYNEEYHGSFCSGYFSAKIDSITPFFNQHNDKSSFYSNFSIFENRITNYINNNIENKEVKLFNDLSKLDKVNQEGLLQFSKKTEKINLENRIDIINFLINKYNYKSYLEIGVRFLSDCYEHIICEEKESVDPGFEDPVNHAKYKMTSDDFFKKLESGILDKKPENKWDIIFIDGLHIADQVERDVINSLNHLSDQGTIIVHDCNPPTEYHARFSYSDHRTPAGDQWNGTVWKAIYKLRCTRPDLDICVINKDWGCGVIRRGEQEICEFSNRFYDFGKLEENRKKHLNLIESSEFEKWIKSPFYN
jgi:hypothetical protein